METQKVLNKNKNSSVADKMESLLTVTSLPFTHFYIWSRVTSPQNIHPFTRSKHVDMNVVHQRCSVIERCRVSTVAPPSHHRQGRTVHLVLRTLGLALPTPGLVARRLPVRPQPAPGEEMQTDPDVPRGFISRQLLLDQHHLRLGRHTGQVFVVLPAVFQSLHPSLLLPHHVGAVAVEVQEIGRECIVPYIVISNAIVLAYCVARLMPCPEKLCHLPASRPHPLLLVRGMPDQSNPIVV